MLHSLAIFTSHPLPKPLALPLTPPSYKMNVARISRVVRKAQTIYVDLKAAMQVLPRAVRAKAEKMGGEIREAGTRIQNLGRKREHKSWYWANWYGDNVGEENRDW